MSKVVGDPEVWVNGIMLDRRSPDDVLVRLAGTVPSVEHVQLDDAVDDQGSDAGSDYSEGDAVKDALDDCHSGFMDWYAELQDYHRAWPVVFRGLLEACPYLFAQFRTIAGLSP